MFRGVEDPVDRNLDGAQDFQCLYNYSGCLSYGLADVVSDHAVHGGGRRCCVYIRVVCVWCIALTTISVYTDFKHFTVSSMGVAMTGTFIA